MKYVFIVGCGRSGTTWLQMLLAQHPEVATTQETHLFSGYITRLQEAWERDRITRRAIGLQAVLTEEEFNKLCADFARPVMDNITKSNPAAKVVLEKTPAHVQHVPLILKLFPDAYFIHLIRDPRSVVASLCAAGESWGRAWASTDPIENARVWVRDVSAGRKIASQTKHHMTVNYEALLAPGGWQVLQDLFRWMELEADSNFCHQAQADCAIDRLRNKGENLKSSGIISDDPAAFYRKGSVDSWADDLSPHDVQAVEYIAGDLMRECGYTASNKSAGRRHKPWHLKRRELLDGLEWRTRRAVTGIFDKLRHLM